MKRFIITESEKSEIRKMYGLINEQAQLPVTVNGNFTATNCDELHAFQGTGGKTIGDMNGKVQQKISELNKQGLKVKVVNVAVNVKGMSVSWSVTIDNSNDGKNWVGFTSRGAGCNKGIETRWNNESVGNGPESIKNKIKEVGIGTVDQIELVKTFTHSDGGNSFKQGFYRYCLVGQNQNNQNQNNQNQQQNNQQQSSTQSDTYTITGTDISNLRENIKNQTYNKGLSIDEDSIRFDIKNLKLTFDKGDTPITSISLVFDPDKKTLDDRIQNKIIPQNPGFTKTGWAGNDGGYYWVLGVIKK